MISANLQLAAGRKRNVYLNRHAVGVVLAGSARSAKRLKPLRNCPGELYYRNAQDHLPDGSIVRSCSHGQGVGITKVNFDPSVRVRESESHLHRFRRRSIVVFLALRIVNTLISLLPTLKSSMAKSGNRFENGKRPGKWRAEQRELKGLVQGSAKPGLARFASNTPC